jgi:copper transport protein
MTSQRPRHQLAPRPPVVLAVLLALLAGASPAGAHALLRQSDPPAGAALDRAPQAVTLIFTEEPEPSLSTIRVLSAAGQDVTRGPARPPAGQPEALRVPLGALSGGAYTVAWRTVSRVDGHVTGGAFAFGIGVTPPAAASPAAQSAPPSPAGALGRWLFYAGLSVLFGAAWVWTLGAAPPAARARTTLWLAWAAAAVGIVLLEESERADVGVAFAAFMRTSPGLALVWQAAPLAGLGIALLLARARGGKTRRETLPAVGVLALFTIAAHAAAGHAAAAPPGWRGTSIGLQWLHFSAAGAWMGGLLALLVALPGAPGEGAAAARRFSAAAGGLIALVAASGVLRAVNEVGAWERLLSTPYGQLVSLKALLLVALGGLGALNRYRYLPAAGRALTGVRRAGAAEVAVAAVALGVTAVLTQTPPANFVAGAAARPTLVASGSDFATSVRATLEVAPGYPGPNTFRLALRDYDTGAPVTAARVTLRFTPADRPDLGASTLPLVRSADGRYRAQGTNLSLEGRWNVVAVVERGVNSVEVPLGLVVPGAPQQVRTIAAPGQPTLYIIDLPGGRVLNAYLDPGRAGLNEIHATYLDAAGRELRLPRPAAITVARPGAAPAPVPVRRFGPGHFIGDATLAAGTWQVEIAVAPPGGALLRSRFTVSVQP